MGCVNRRRLAMLMSRNSWQACRRRSAKKSYLIDVTMDFLSTVSGMEIEYNAEAFRYLRAPDPMTGPQATLLIPSRQIAGQRRLFCCRTAQDWPTRGTNVSARSRSIAT